MFPQFVPLPVRTAPVAPPTVVPSASETELPFSLTGGPAAGAARAPAKTGPLPAPIAAAELHALVAPAVVALVVSGAKTAPQVATGVLVTASGLILTSRRAITGALEGGGKLFVAHGGPRGRFGSHELGDAVPARVLALADELDLALVEALPASSVFYPHLPISRHPAAAGATVLALGHTRERGLWAGGAATLAAAATRVGTARWLRDVSAGALAPGTPLIDGVGRVAALVTEPQPGALRGVDADALLRFLLSGQAPARRFAGVPPYRRLSTLVTHAAQGPATADGQAGGPLAGLIPAKDSDDGMPGVSNKGSLDQHLRSAEARAARRPPVLEKTDVSAAGASPSQVSFEVPANVLQVTAAELDRHAVPEVVKVETDDAPERGSRSAWVTIVELGDYHALETRQAEPTIQALVEGDGAQARLLWKDADRGDGAAYHLAARAARAAGEQDDFWSMHDRLMEGARMARLEDARRLARAIELDPRDFEAVMDGDGLLNAIETDGEKAGRIPALGTPSFIVNGHVVDGGSVAGAALRAAVDEELALAEARAARQPLDGVVAKRCRLIADGKPIAGTAFNPASLTATVVAAATRNEAKARRASGHEKR